MVGFPKLIITMAITVFLTAATILCLEMHYWGLAILTQADQIASDANSVAIFTIRTEGEIKKNLAINLNAITGEQGHLSQFNSTAWAFGNAMQKHVGDMEVDLSAAVGGTNQRAGLLDMFSSVTRTSDRVGDTVGDIGNLSEGIRTGYFECPGPGCSRDRVSAFVKPFYSSAQQVDEALPLFLDCDHNPSCLFNRYQGTSKAVEGISQDFHLFTSKFVAPRPLRAKIWDGAKLVVYGAARAF